MNSFEENYRKLDKESREIQEREMRLKADAELFHQKFFGFLKENGLPENFTMPQLGVLVLDKSRSVIIKP